MKVLIIIIACIEKAKRLKKTPVNKFHKWSFQHQITGCTTESPHMYAAVQSEHVNAEKCQKHIIVFKNSQARNTTLSANVTGYVFFFHSYCHSMTPQEGYENICKT